MKHDVVSNDYVDRALILTRPILNLLISTRNDDSTLTLFLPIKPQAKQSVRFANGRGAYTDPQKKLYVGNLVAKLHAYGMEYKFKGPVAVATVFCFGWRVSDRVKTGHAIMSQRPDLDNLKKPVYDALTQSCVLSDDGAICLDASMKIRCEFEGIAIKVIDLSAIECIRSQAVT